MELIQAGVAGTMESSDIYVELEKSGRPGVEVELESSVKSLYGRQIEKVIRETLAQYQVEGVRVVARDKGALDCTVKARVTAALFRASGSQDYAWER